MGYFVSKFMVLYILLFLFNGVFLYNLRLCLFSLGLTLFSNLLAQKKNIDKSNGLPIHRTPPKFEDLATSTEVLTTGIKVIDLIEPYAKGGKIGLFGGAGVGKTNR